MKASEANTRRISFRTQLIEAFRGLGAAGLRGEVPALTVVGLKLQENSEYGKVIWRNFDEFRQDVTNAIEDSGVCFDFRYGFMTSGVKFRQAIDSHKPALLVSLDMFRWGDIEPEFSKDKLIRDTNSVIRDAVRVIGSDNNRLTDKTLICLIAGKLQVGGDNSNVWKEAAKNFTKHSFVKFLKDLLDHSSLVHNASYTDANDLVRLLDDEINHHHTIRGKLQWGSETLSW